MAPYGARNSTKMLGLQTVRCSRVSVLSRVHTLSAMAVTCSFWIACASVPPSVAVPVAASVDGQRGFGELEEAWERGEDPVSLSRNCRGWLQRHPSDPGTVRVMAFLAMTCALTGDRACATEAIAKVRKSVTTGTPFDIATLAEARLLRTAGQAEAAINKLRPLAGKWVDPGASTLFVEELAEASLAAHVEFEALGYLDAWLEVSKGDDFAATRKRVKELVSRLPRTVLESSFDAMTNRQSPYGIELKRLCVERLAELAVERNDSVMARRIADRSELGIDRELFRKVEELALSTKGLRLVRGKTVALVLPVGNTNLRDESAEVLRGVTFALGLTQGNGIRLVTRNAPESPELLQQALEELAGEGATMIIGGLDVEGATRLVQWGAVSNVSVLALAEPGVSVTKGAVLGLDRREETRFLQRQLAAIHVAEKQSFPKNWSVVAESAASAKEQMKLLTEEKLAFRVASSCDVPTVGAGSVRFTSFDKAASEANDVNAAVATANGRFGWLFLGSRDCLRDFSLDAVRHAGTQAMTTTLEAGIPAGDVRLDGLRVVSVRSGRVPFIASSIHEITEPELVRYAKAYASVPSYWTALGRDAGTLAAAALAPLPDDVTENDAMIFQRRATVEAGLVHAEVAFWTSNHRKLDASRRLPRELELVRTQIKKPK
jgi:hypothetical protein